jgi:hypothetical protein
LLLLKIYNPPFEKVEPKTTFETVEPKTTFITNHYKPPLKDILHHNSLAPPFQRWKNL